MNALRIFVLLLINKQEKQNQPKQKEERMNETEKGETLFDLI